MDPTIIEIAHWTAVAVASGVAGALAAWLSTSDEYDEEPNDSEEAE
jgi:hypothetical protein